MKNLMSAQTFHVSLNRWAKTIPDFFMAQFHRDMTLSLLKKVVLRNPVLTGRSRGNWNVMVGEPDLSFDWDRYDRSGHATMARGVAALSGLRPGAITWITNNIVYINLIENGQGGRMPGFMVARSVEELRVEARVLARAIKVTF